MVYEFLVETYATERLKVLSVWSEFRDEDLKVRPNPSDSRGRSVHEQMVHQCVSEDLWFRTMLGIDVSAPPVPEQETRLEFIRRYAEDSAKRLIVLEGKSEEWWEEGVKFFDVERSLRRKEVPGGPGPKMVSRQLVRAATMVARTRRLVPVLARQTAAAKEVGAGVQHRKRPASTSPTPPAS